MHVFGDDLAVVFLTRADTNAVLRVWCTTGKDIGLRMNKGKSEIQAMRSTPAFTCTFTPDQPGATVSITSRTNAIYKYLGCWIPTQHAPKKFQTGYFQK